MHDQTETLTPSADGSAPAADFDSPWKEAMDTWFQPFMALFFPTVHDLIDWTRPHEFLDAELQRLTGDSEVGRRTADRLVRVKLLRFIDWLIRLPRVLEQALRQELIESEEGRKMPYVTSWEQFAREEGRQEGEARVLLRQLRAKFGPPSADLTARVERAELPELERWLDRILTASAPEDVFDPR